MLVDSAATMPFVLSAPVTASTACEPILTA